MTSEERDRQDSSDFLREAEGAQRGFLREFWYFLRYNKKWWLLPIILALLLLGVFAVLSTTPAAPFLYPFW